MQNAYIWQEVELTLHAAQSQAAPYTNVEVWAEFTHSDGAILRRPAFWDGGDIWKVRFASPLASGRWSWRSFANVEDDGLAGRSGELACAPNQSSNRFHRHGFWKMSPGGRNLVHADGTPCLLVGDTAWALPWRATPEQCEIYAQDRQRKGFNAALLMTVQPDRKANGPRDRTQDFGFDVGFEDLRDGHLNELNISYFQTLDRLMEILVAHEIVPVYQPVFHGYGWKGLDVAGPVVPADEYARFCRYLVARYGARPAIYLVGGDGKGYFESIRAGGDEIEKWDCYAQPTGIHYCPHADNRAWQGEAWLDFQWCQTGHNGENIPERVADMWRNEPIKAVANGEPTYENIGFPGNGAGWWQGHEAWCNLCAGGTMGTVYGAGSLWQWRLHAQEPGHQDWCLAHGAGWREALDFEGSGYVGALSRIFDGLPFADMQPNWDFTYGRRALAVPGKLLVVYLENGGGLAIISDEVPLSYRVIDPKTGATISSGTRPKVGEIPIERGAPRVVIFCDL
jgi:hypothetical protein